MRTLTFVCFLSALIALTSCSAQDEPMSNASDSNTVSAAHVTLTYTVPEEIFKYAEITACYNNNDCTDALWEPMLDNKFTVTYDLTKFPEKALAVFVYKKTNRPSYGVSVDWEITMDYNITLNVNGEIVNLSNSEKRTITGDLGAALDELQRDATTRTYAAKISKKGDVTYLH